jgi:hypothetical protein
MRNLAIVIAVVLGVMPGLIMAPSNVGGTAQIADAAGGGRGGGGGGRATGGGGGGFNLSNDVPATRPSSSGNTYGNGNRGFNLSNDVPASRTMNNTSANNRINNTDVNNRVNNTNVSNRNNNTNVNRNTNNTNVNRNTNNTNVNRNTNNTNVNRNVNVNGYGYRGPVVVNPVYRGPAWGWNHGAVWTPAPAYWGGGFWGAFAVGAASAIVMGSIVNAATHQTYTSYQVSQGSPGAQLLSNYHLQQVPCGPPNLVVIYGPNNGVICANPNDLVSAGNYAVNADTLTLQSP